MISSSDVILPVQSEVWDVLDCNKLELYSQGKLVVTENPTSMCLWHAYESSNVINLIETKVILHVTLFTEKNKKISENIENK